MLKKFSFKPTSIIGGLSVIIKYGAIILAIYKGLQTVKEELEKLNQSEQ